MKPPVIWTCKKFEELSPTELYAILRLRSEVFVVEQNCVYLDPDGKDAESYHFCGWLNNELLVAYTRLMPPGSSYTDASIGRVVTAPAHRNEGYGKILMHRSIEKCFELFETPSITIGAQQYLTQFYQELGFKQAGEMYLEDGIPHIKMTLIK
jgi:ElaA protein